MRCELEKVKAERDGLKGSFDKAASGLVKHKASTEEAAVAQKAVEDAASASKVDLQGALRREKARFDHVFGDFCPMFGVVLTIFWSL